MLHPCGTRLAALLVTFCLSSHHAYGSATPFPSEETAETAAIDIATILNMSVPKKIFTVAAFKINEPFSPSPASVTISPLYIDTSLPVTAAVVDEVSFGILSRTARPLATASYPGSLFQRIIITHPSLLSATQQLFPAAQVIINKSYSSSLKSLRSGAVDGIICDAKTAEFLKRFSQFSSFDFKTYPQLHAYIFLDTPSSSEADALRTAVRSQPAVIYRSIYDKWQVITLAKALDPVSKNIPYILTGTLLLVIVILSFVLTHLLRSRRDTAQQLSDALQFWESLIQSIPTPTLVSTPEGTITHSNTALLRYLDTAEETLMGTNLQQFSENYEIAPSLNTRLLVDAITHPTPHFTESTICILGRSLSLLQWMSVINDATMTPRGVVIGWIDITERKILEKDLAEALNVTSRASEEKSRFLARMSHELRSPLNVISGVLESVIDNPAYDSSLLPVAGGAVNQLLGTIGNILDLSKIEAGELRVNLTPTSIQPLFEEIASNHHFMANQKELSFQYDITEVSGFTYMCDKVKVSQIINNLLSNAVKYTVTGSINFCVKRMPLSEDVHELHILIRDTGIGIHENDKALILEPYKQVDDSVPKSTGLGLSITNELIRLMGGQLFIESVKNKGSEFRVVLPLAIASDMHSVPEKSHGLSPRSILAVDDSPANLTVLSLQLSQLGHTILAATDGDRALTLLKENPGTDIIITDCQMEPTDGYTLAREVRRSEEITGKNHFILGVTANAFSDEEFFCLSAGMDGVLIKPFRSEALAQALSSYAHLHNFNLNEVISLAGNQHNLRGLLVEMSSSSRKDMEGITEYAQQMNITMLKATIHKVKGVYGLVDFAQGMLLCEEIERQIKTNHDFSITVLKLTRANYHFCQLIDHEIKKLNI